MRELIGLLSRYNKIDRRKVNCTVFFFYFACVILIMIFHEPSWDESNAWLIARSASYKDMIFHISHYEGHPPLWHLMLSIPAKLGLPFEISLKGIQVICCSSMILVFLRKSPFNNYVRSIIPFTYFLLYQFGVIARPYALLSALIFLSADAVMERNKKPLYLVMVLAGLCLVSAFGIAIAGGIAVAWVVEIIRGSVKAKRGILDLFENKRRLAGFICLLLTAIVQILLIWPAQDNSIARLNVVGSAGDAAKRMIRFVFLIPSESALTSFVQDGQINNPDLDTNQFIFAGVISGVLIIMTIRRLIKAKQTLFFVLPFVFFGVVAVNYLFAHHIGIVFVLFVYSVWISDVKEDNQGRVNKYFRLVEQIICALICVIGVYWSMTSSINDIVYQSDCGRKLKEWFSQFDNPQIAASFYITGKENDTYSFDSGIGSFVPVAPYFEPGILCNPYATDYVITEANKNFTADMVIEMTQTMQPPEFVFSVGSPSVTDTYLHQLNTDLKYIPVHMEPVVDRGYIFKDATLSVNGVIIYAREDICEKYKLQSIVL